MAQNNDGKWFHFQNGEILYGPPGIGQNLNGYLQEYLANEIDFFLRGMVGDGVMGVGSWAVTPSTGLAVLVAAGAGVIDGQLVKSNSILSISALPSSTAEILVYVKAGYPWSSAVYSWPAVVGIKTSPLVLGEMHLASVSTDGSSVVGVTDRRRILTPVSLLTEQKNSRARQAASGVL